MLVGASWYEWLNIACSLAKSHSQSQWGFVLTQSSLQLGVNGAGQMLAMRMAWNTETELFRLQDFFLMISVTISKSRTYDFKSSDISSSNPVRTIIMKTEGRSLDVANSSHIDAVYRQCWPHPATIKRQHGLKIHQNRLVSSLQCSVNVILI